MKYWAEDTIRRRGRFTHSDVGWANGIVEALARHRKKKARKVLRLLEGRYDDEDPAVMDWLWPCFVDLAGEMRLEEGVPLLVDHLDDDDLNLLDSVHKALERVGGDVVVREINARWWNAEDIEFRRSAACILDCVRGDLCIERCLDFFKEEEDRETKRLLADALLGNFSTEAVDLIWKFLADRGDGELGPDEWDSRYRLLAVCTITGRTFPHFDDWREAALRDNWGRSGLGTWRVADDFKPESFGPRASEN